MHDLSHFRANFDQIAQRLEQRSLYDLELMNELGYCQGIENYSRYFIHSRTDIFIMDKLIDEAKLTYHYSMDTEGDPITHGPATIQVEFIREHKSPIIIIIEANYLPPTNSPLFKKIQHLSSIIFTLNNTIYSWGPPKEELNKFNSIESESQEYNVTRNYLDWLTQIPCGI